MAHLDRVGCLDLDGCSWLTGGREERPDWAGGSCTGTAIQCSTFEELDHFAAAVRRGCMSCGPARG